MQPVYPNAEAFFEALDRQGPRSHPNEALVPTGSRPCPICGQAMQVEHDFAVTLDVCPAHGVWLDQGELEEILAAARSVPVEHRSRLLERARQEGKLQGIAFNWLSLFMR